eukprot:SAG11_NODE_26761_length_341_cov_0.644628_1_plen_37_part_10
MTLRSFIDQLAPKDGGHGPTGPRPVADALGKLVRTQV